jgi:hypothetical protein
VAGIHNSIRVPLAAPKPVLWGPARRREPITIGIPLPPGRAFSPDQIELDAAFKLVTPAQIRALDSWPDGSIRWALLDFMADAPAGLADEPPRATRPAPPSSGVPVTGVRVSADERGIEVETGAATFRFHTGGPFPVSSLSIGTVEPIDPAASGVQIDASGTPITCRIAEVVVHETGPVRAEIEVRAAPLDPLPIMLAARVELFAGMATVRVQISLVNRRRARHPAGQWVLGDEGSVLLRSVAWLLTVAGSVQRVRCAPERGLPLDDVDVPFELFQESSGGDHWNGAIHRNREGRVPLRFRGYRLRSGRVERTADRATPVVAVATERGEIGVAVPQFWENFPRAIGVDGRTIEIGLFPRQSSDGHELQGGEQKTHEVIVAFADDAVSDPPLAWCHDPLFTYPAADWCCATGAVPYLIPEADDPNPRYVSLVAGALDPQQGFAAKNERADEFGWRNYGDLHADHESAFQPPDRALVSHYNNQYDAVACFAWHFLRTGDHRWWRLMTDLVRHVRDIDIYRTRDDKAAYNSGLFWHTSHYTDADTATHRTYPRGAPGGGPSAEHNYNAGLMLHYFMTGERASREAAIGLARWVIDMDDGRQTLFRLLASGATGLASATGSTDYHGPGRAPANSICACLVGARLTDAPEYVAKADELIRRCIHPADDIVALRLDDVERRWYYTVFLQALGWYLHHQGERRQFDETYLYARDSLLHYARWMVVHERPYLDRPEVLEFPNATWIAQDMRKGDVLLWAAQHATGEERVQFLDRARFFFDYSIDALSSNPTRTFTRILVLLLSNGLRYGWAARQGWSLPPPVVTAARSPGALRAPFEPQKTRARRRAVTLAFLGALLTIAVTAFWIL